MTRYPEDLRHLHAPVVLVVAIGILIGMLSAMFSGCAEVDPEPPVIIGEIALRRDATVPERYTVTVPIINRAEVQLDRYTLAVLVVRENTDEHNEEAGEAGRHRSARMRIETAVSAGGRSVDSVSFDSPFPIVTAAPLRLERVLLREFTFGGLVHAGTLRYPLDVVEEN